MFSIKGLCGFLVTFILSSPLNSLVCCFGRLHAFLNTDPLVFNRTCTPMLSNHLQKPKANHCLS